MNEPSKTPEELLDLSATDALQGLVEDFRDILLSEAFRSSSDSRISADDLQAAFERLYYPTKDSIQFTDAQAVISQAFKENRIFEWVSYGMAVILFVFGLVWYCCL